MDVAPHFERLIAGQRAGIDYQVVLLTRPSPVTIVAPHGGGIEPGTSELGLAVAGHAGPGTAARKHSPQFSCYLFEGLCRDGNQRLHLDSTRFDDPACLELVRQSQAVLAIHGCRGRGSMVHIGGLDQELGARLLLQLDQAGFTALPDETWHAGRDPRNLCNRGLSGRGAQLELSEPLRRSLFAGLDRRARQQTTPAFARFVAAVRAALAPC